MRFLACLAFVTGCVGTIDTTGSSATTDPTAPDAGQPVGGGGGGGGGGTDGGVASPFPCRNPTVASSSGHHNPGQDCMNGCHNHGFTLAGTLYATGGATPTAGATITVKDSNGAAFDMVTGTNGNFYTSQAVAFPIKVYASSCPTSLPMSASIASSGAGCNNTGCHAAGAQGHIHL